MKKATYNQLMQTCSKHCTLYIYIYIYILISKPEKIRASRVEDQIHFYIEYFACVQAHKNCRIYDIIVRHVWASLRLKCSILNQNERMRCPLTLAQSPVLLGRSNHVL